MVSGSNLGNGLRAPGSGLRAAVRNVNVQEAPAATRVVLDVKLRLGRRGPAGGVSAAVDAGRRQPARTCLFGACCLPAAARLFVLSSLQLQPGARTAVDATETRNSQRADVAKLCGSGRQHAQQTAVATFTFAARRLVMMGGDEPEWCDGAPPSGAASAPVSCLHIAGLQAAGQRPLLQQDTGDQRLTDGCPTALLQLARPEM